MDVENRKYKLLTINKLLKISIYCGKWLILNHILCFISIFKIKINFEDIV